MLLFVLDLQQLAGRKIARKPPETNPKYQAQYSQLTLPGLKARGFLDQSVELISVWLPPASRDRSVPKR